MEAPATVCKSNLKVSGLLVEQDLKLLSSFGRFSNAAYICFSQFLDMHLNHLAYKSRFCRCLDDII